MKCLNKTVLRHVRVVDPGQGLDEVRDLAIDEGRFCALSCVRPGWREVELDGCIVAPGFCDVHVHFRDPGNPAAETRATGAQAAAAGGFTRVVTMPNTTPACDNAAQLREQLEDATLPVRILPSACISRERAGEEPVDFDALAAAGAAAFTDDGAMVVSDEVMRAAMVAGARLGLPVMDHAVVPARAKGGVIRDCALAREKGWPIFPDAAEVEAVTRDIRLCAETGCRVDIQHVSSAESVRLIRAARAQGLPVTGEATPHHLALAVEDIHEDDARRYKMNPPLGTRRDAEAIAEGVLDGTLALFATDHAPHTAEAKARGFAQAPFGIIGLETALGVTWRVMVEGRGMPVSDFVARWTTGPAALLGVPPPKIAEGAEAEITIIEPQPWRVDASRFFSRSRNSPFDGWTLPVRARSL